MQGTRSAIASLVALSLVALPATTLGQASEGAAVDADAPTFVTWEGGLDYFFSVDVPEEVLPWGERGPSGLHVSFKASDPRVSGEQISVAFMTTRSSKPTAAVAPKSCASRMPTVPGKGRSPR